MPSCRRKNRPDQSNVENAERTIHAALTELVSPNEKIVGKTVEQLGFASMDDVLKRFGGAGKDGIAMIKNPLQSTRDKGINLAGLNIAGSNSGYIETRDESLQSRSAVKEIASRMGFYNLDIFDEKGRMRATNSDYDHLDLQQIMQTRMARTLQPLLSGQDNTYFHERWNSPVPLRARTAEGKLIFVLRCMIIVLAVMNIYLFITKGASLPEDSFLRDLVRGDWERGMNLYAVTASEMIIVVAIFLCAALHQIVFRIARFSTPRGETVCHLVYSVITY